MYSIESKCLDFDLFLTVFYLCIHDDNGLLHGIIWIGQKENTKENFFSLFMIWHQWVNTHDRYLWFTMRCHQKSISLHAKGIWIISSTGFLCSHFDGLVQERCNSIANTLELRLSCTNPLICCRGMIIWQGARIIAQVMAACGLAPLPCHLGAVSI